jgi:hypothetical protein
MLKSAIVEMTQGVVMKSGRYILAGLLGAVALSSLATARAAAPDDAGPYLLMHRVSIVDRGDRGQPVEAASILLPKDWRVESGVVWTGDIGCPRNGIKLGLKAQSPDGTLGFEVFPDYVWNWVDDPQARAYTNPMAAYGIKGCDTLPPYDAAGYLQNLFLPRWRAGSTLVGIGQVPELIQAMQMEFAAMSGGQPSPIRTDFDVALAAIETPRAGGTDEEWVLASLVRTVAYLPVLSSMGTFGNQMSGNYTLAAVSQFAARAPKGQLERHEKLFEVIYRSFRLNPLWESAVARHFETMERINLKGVQDRQRILHQSQQEISAMIEQGYNARQAVMDRSAERQIQALRGVETYIDPATRTRVDLTTGYQGAWTNGLGDYVLSDAPGFNPARELEGNWTALQPEGR